MMPTGHLMGSNMQRQAVPLLFTQAPLVGTGMEEKGCPRFRGGNFSRVTRGLSFRSIPTVLPSSVTSVEVTPLSPLDTADKDEYRLTKFSRSNQDCCINQRPVVQRWRQGFKRAGDRRRTGY